MLSFEFYRGLHFLSIAFVLMGLGAASFLSLAGQNVREHSARKVIGITHGAGLFGVLVGGFGMLARGGLMADGIPGWVFAKLALWLVVGALLAVAMRVPGAGKVLWGLLPVLVALAGWLAMAKPF